MSTKDLMARMGHDDERAALIYQRVTREADERIVAELSKLRQHRPSRKRLARPKGEAAEEAPGRR